ncbi:MAG: hypothetical protein ABL890_00950 [Candidatus Peribacteraceae bacterium]
MNFRSLFNGSTDSTDTKGSKRKRPAASHTDTLSFEKLEERQVMDGSQLMNFDELGIGDHAGAMYGVLDNGVGLTAWNGYDTNGSVNVSPAGEIRSSDARTPGKQGITINFDEGRELIDKIVLSVSSNFRGGLLITDREGDFREIQLSGSKTIREITRNINERVGAISLRVDIGTASIKNITFNEVTNPDTTNGIARYDVTNPVQHVALLPEQTSVIPENAIVSIGENLTAQVRTGWQLHGTVMNEGVLYAIGDHSGNAGTAQNPRGKDGIIFKLGSRTAGISELRIAADTGTAGYVIIKGHLPDQRIEINGETVIPWNTVNGIDSIEIGRYSGGRVGLKGVVMPMQRTGTQSHIVPYAHSDEWDEHIDFLVAERLHEVIDINRDTQVAAPPLIASLRATGIAANITRANNLEKLLINLQKQAHLGDDETRVLEYVASRAADRQETLVSLQQEIDQMIAEERRGFTPLPPMDGLTELIELLKSGTLSSPEQTRLENALKSLSGSAAKEEVSLGITDQLMQTAKAMNPQWSLDGSVNRQQELIDRREAIKTITDAYAYLGEMMLERGRSEGILSRDMQLGKLDFARSAGGMEEVIDRFMLEAHQAEYSIEDRLWETLPNAENFIPRAASVATNGKFILSGGTDGRIVLQKSGTGEVLTTLKNYGESIQALEFLSEDKALIRLSDRAVVLSLTGEEIGVIPFNGRTVNKMHVVEGTHNIAVSFNFVSGQPNKAFIYSAEGTVVKEVNLGNSPVTNVTFAKTENAYAFSQNQYVYMKNLTNGQVAGGFNWWTLTGQNYDTQSLVMDGDENGAFIFAGARNDNNGIVSNSTIVALTKTGTKIDHYTLGSGAILDKMVDLGDGLLGITIRNQYVPTKQMVIIRLVGNRFEEVSRTTPTLYHTTDIAMAPDFTGVLNIKADGTELVPLPQEIQDGGAFRSIASGLQPLSFGAIPDDVGGRNILQGMQDHLRNMLVTFTGDRRFNLNNDFVWAKFLEANPHLTHEALAAQYGAGTPEYNNAIYRRNAEYDGVYRTKIDLYNKQMTIMIHSAYAALVQEAHYEDPTGPLNELNTAEASQWIRTFEPIGIQHFTTPQMLSAVRQAIIAGAGDFSEFQDYANAQGLQQQRRMNNPNYAGSGAATPTPRQVHENQRYQAWLNSWSNVPMYAGDGVTVIGQGGQLFTQISQGEGYGGELSASAALLSSLNSLTFTASFMEISARGKEMIELRDQLRDSELIHVDLNTLAGRMYIWFVDSIDNANTVDEVYSLCRGFEAFSGIDWWDTFSSVYGWDVSAENFARHHAWDTHQSFKVLFEERGLDKTFKNLQGSHPIMFDIGTERYVTWDPGNEEHHAYINYQSGDRAPDRAVRVYFDVAPGSIHPTYDHADVYLSDHNGNPITDDQGRDIKLTNTDVRGQLFADIPLASIIQYLDKIPSVQQSTNAAGSAINVAAFKFRVITWLGNQTDSPRMALTTEKVVEIRATSVPSADLSHLPETHRDILNSLKSPVQIQPGKPWYIYMLSDMHTGSGVYALDWNMGSAGEDMGIPVFAPGKGKVLSVDTIKGSLYVEMTTRNGEKFTVGLLHMENILEEVTGMTYQGMASFLKQRFSAAWASAPGHNNYEKYEHLKQNGGEEIKAAIEIHETYLLSVKDEIYSRINSPDELHIIEGQGVGAIGDEGYSKGSHLDMRVSFEVSANNVVPVNLFGWADAQFPGINIRNVTFGGGKTLNFIYDRQLNALTNEAERIVWNRTSGAENLAYAWEEGVALEALTQIHWERHTYIDDDGIFRDQEIWVGYINGVLQRWNGTEFKLL